MHVQTRGIVCVLLSTLGLVDCSAQHQYQFELPDGRHVVYQPVDSLLVVEFCDTLSAARKRDIITDLNLTMLPIQVKKNYRIQNINDSILVLRASARNRESIRKAIQRNYASDIRGVLPAFELDQRLCYLRPTTFGLTFYRDIHQDSVDAVLQRHRLTLHDPARIKANPYPFYVMKLAYVDTESHADIFDLIRRVSKERQVYSAFPLFVASGYALVHGPSPIPTNKLLGERPEFLDKVDSDLERLYWVWKTANLDILNELAHKAVVTTRKDSVKVKVILSERNVDAWLKETGVRLMYPIHQRSARSTAVAFVSWQNIEKLAQSEKVSYIAVADH